MLWISPSSLSDAPPASKADVASTFQDDTAPGVKQAEPLSHFLHENWFDADECDTVDPSNVCIEITSNVSLEFLPWTTSRPYGTTEVLRYVRYELDSDDEHIFTGKEVKLTLSQTQKLMQALTVIEKWMVPDGNDAAATPMSARDIHLGGDIHVTMSESYPILDIRRFFRGYKGGRFPTKSGVALAPYNFSTFRDALMYISSQFLDKYYDWTAIKDVALVPV